jgi:hypothetical protein
LQKLIDKALSYACNLLKFIRGAALMEELGCQFDVPGSPADGDDRGCRRENFDIVRNG